MGDGACVDKVIEYLYVGDKRTARNMKKMQDLGIAYIVNATIEIRNYFDKEPGFNYFNVPIMDTDIANVLPYFNEAIEFIDEGRAQGHSVFIHCQQGVSRSACIALAYLMKKKRMSLKEGYTLLKRARPQVRVRPNFLKQLVIYSQQLDNEKNRRPKKKHKKLGPTTPDNKLTHKVSETTAINDHEEFKPFDDCKSNLPLDNDHVKDCNEKSQQFMGPTMPPNVNGSNSHDKLNVESINRTTKGPALPPHMIPNQIKESILAPDMKSKPIKGPALPPHLRAKTVKGPSFPPHLSA